MRYDVYVEMKQHFTLAMDADSAGEASAKALAALGDAQPAKMEIIIQAEVGVREL